MRVPNLHPSKYLRAGDFDDDRTLTIRSLIREEINQEKKPVLYFREEVQEWY